MKDDTFDASLVQDVVIFGGGCSGVYSAMRILEGPRAPDSPLGTGPLKVTVYEMSDRIGGRLLSLEPPGVPSTRVEVGGMRYTSEHKYVIDLVNNFGLTPNPFPVREPQNFVYVRGTLLRNADLTDASKVPYRLAPDETDPKVMANGYTALAAVRLLNAITGSNGWTEQNLGQADWFEISQTYQFEGNYIRDLPFRYLNERMVSHEAFQFNYDTGGYDSILYTWNGADGFPWNLGDFGADIKYFHVAEGYEKLPILCAASVGVADGGEVVMNTELVQFAAGTFPDGTEGVTYLARTGDQEFVGWTRRLVLAMPQRSIDLLADTGGLFDAANTRVRDLVEAVTPIPLFKLALCYDKAWWENIAAPSGMGKITSGESVTDLPVRQLYYWHTDATTGKAVVLIYDDGLALDYWAGLRSDELPYKGDPGSSSGDGLPDWANYPAPARMVEEAHRQILEMHGLPGDASIPMPYAAAYMDWGDDPYGGGAYFWHVGVESFAVSKAIVQPDPSLPVYVVGECWSHQQGWVEGALTTAEDMLLNHLGILPAAWQTAS